MKEGDARPNLSEFADLLLIVPAQFLSQTSFKNSLFLAELSMIWALNITNNTWDQAMYIGKFRETCVDQMGTNTNPYIMKANSSCFMHVDPSPFYY